MWAALWALASSPPAARAHEVNTALGVLVVEGAPSGPACPTSLGLPRPLLVQTGIGAVRALDDGSFEFGCPSLYGEATPLMAASADGAVLVAVSGGEPAVSRDLGCSFEPIAVDGSGWAYEVASGVASAAVLERDATHARLRLVADDGVPVVASWPLDELRPDTAVDGSARSPATWFVAGARPELGLARIDATGVLTPLNPPPVAGAQRLAIRAVGADGTIWVVATTDRGRTTWRATLGTGAALQWTEVGGAAETIRGPVQLGNRWWAVRDGVATRFDGAAGWVSVEPVSWRCLVAVGGEVWGCDLYELLHLSDRGESLPQATTVFDTAQIAPPGRACDRPPDVVEACGIDWVHYGSENFYLDREAASCPGGAAAGSGAGAGDAGLSDAGGRPGADRAGGGCASSARAPLGSIGWAMLGWLGVSTRRRREGYSGSSNCRRSRTLA